MSIYATLTEFGIKRFGDGELIDILVQAVPPHIDYTGPDWEFLPPPVDPEGTVMRAVVFIEAGDEKGTERCAQEYVKPLLVLTGSEYNTIRFIDLINRLENALDRKYGQRPIAIVTDAEGNKNKYYD